MKRGFLITILFLSLSMACSINNFTNGGPDSASEDQPVIQSEKRCGDNVCDGPENSQNCPQDCLLVSTGQEGQVSENAQTVEESPPAQREPGYRYVSFSGSISTALNTESMDDFSGTAFEYSGEYKVELWFPMEGGEAVQQRNSLTFTKLHDLYFGDAACTPCEWSLDDHSFDPVEIQLNASLNLGAIMEDGEPTDELVYQLSELPQASIGGVVTCACPNSAPDNFSDPGAYTQLLAWFLQNFSNPIHLNSVESNTVDMFPISPMGYINIPNETLSYTIVPNLQTP